MLHTKRSIDKEWCTAFKSCVYYLFPHPKMSDKEEAENRELFNQYLQHRSAYANIWNFTLAHGKRKWKEGKGNFLWFVMICCSFPSMFLKMLQSFILWLIAAMIHHFSFSSHTPKNFLIAQAWDGFHLSTPTMATLSHLASQAKHTEKDAPANGRAALKGGSTQLAD